MHEDSNSYFQLTLLDCIKSINDVNVNRSCNMVVHLQLILVVFVLTISYG